MKKYRIIAVAAVAFSILVISASFLLKTNAEKLEYWITIDEKEFAQVRAGLSARNDLMLANAEIHSIRNGIAILRLNNAQMEKLSAEMHTNFHKCSGFIWHDGLEDALSTADNFFAIDANQQFVDYTIDNQANVNQMLPEAQEPQVRQTIIDLSAFPNRRYNQASGTDSANWIKNKWTQLANGRSDVSVQFYSHPAATSPQPSIILTIQGTTLPNEIVVLGGHQDSINSGGATAAAPGADDDASGIACLTEIIRVLMAKNFRPQRTVQFMAYAAEEVGLRGSAAIALDYRNQNKNVVGVMQLDMTNYKGSAAFDIVIFQDFVNAPQNVFVQNLITTYQPTLAIGTSSCGYGCSDHASWHNRGYPASMPAEATFADTNNALHTVNDTISRSSNNANHALKFSKLGISFVGELAKGVVAPQSVGKPRIDYDGDGKADISVFRPSEGNWYLNRSLAGFGGFNWGLAADKLAPADYSGDGKTDLAIFRPTATDGIADFYILNLSNFTFSGFAWGIPGDLPSIADYDGDGKDDIGIYRSSSNTWYALNSGNGSVLVKQFGQANDKPINGDFDGDGKGDLTLLRNSNEWISLKSSLNYASSETTNFGATGDIAAPADFDGDGKDNIGVFRPSLGTWFYRNAAGNLVSIQFGANGDVPVPDDFDGDGKADIAVFRSGTWHILNSLNSSYRGEQFGSASDLALQASLQP